MRKILSIFAAAISCFAQETNEFGLLTTPETYIEWQGKLYSETNGYKIVMIYCVRPDVYEREVISDETGLVVTNLITPNPMFQIRMRKGEPRWPMQEGDEVFIANIGGQIWTNRFIVLASNRYIPTPPYYTNQVQKVATYDLNYIAWCTNGYLNSAYIDFEGGKLRYRNIGTREHPANSPIDCLDISQ